MRKASLSLVPLCFSPSPILNCECWLVQKAESLPEMSEGHSQQLAALGVCMLPAAQWWEIREIGIQLWQAWHSLFGNFQERTWVIKTRTVTVRNKREFLSETKQNFKRSSSVCCLQSSFPVKLFLNWKSYHCFLRLARKVQLEEFLSSEDGCF